MSTHRSVHAMRFEGVLLSINNEPVIRLAETSLKNGSSSRAEKDDAIRDAQAAGVTNCEYLRARLLLGITGGDTPRFREWLKG